MNFNYEPLAVVKFGILPILGLLESILGVYYQDPTYSKDQAFTFLLLAALGKYCIEEIAENGGKIVVLLTHIMLETIEAGVFIYFSGFESAPIIAFAILGSLQLFIYVLDCCFGKQPQEPASSSEDKVGDSETPRTVKAFKYPQMIDLAAIAGNASTVFATQFADDFSQFKAPWYEYLLTVFIWFSPYVPKIIYGAGDELIAKIISELGILPRDDVPSILFFYISGISVISMCVLMVDIGENVSSIEAIRRLTHEYWRELVVYLVIVIWFAGLGFTYMFIKIIIKGEWNPTRILPAHSSGSAVANGSTGANRSSGANRSTGAKRNTRKTKFKQVVPAQP